MTLDRVGVAMAQHAAGPCITLVGTHIFTQYRFKVTRVGVARIAGLDDTVFQAWKHGRQGCSFTAPPSGECRQAERFTNHIVGDAGHETQQSRRF